MKRIYENYVQTIIQGMTPLQDNLILSIHQSQMFNPIYPNRRVQKSKEEQIAEMIKDLADKKKMNMVNRHQFTRGLPYECTTDKRLPEEELRIILMAKDSERSRIDDFNFKNKSPQPDPTKEPEIRQSKVKLYNWSITEYILSEYTAMRNHHEYDKTKGDSNGKLTRPNVVSRIKIFNDIREKRIGDFIAQILGCNTEIDLSYFFIRLRAIDSLRRRNEEQVAPTTAEKACSYYNTISKQPQDFQDSQYFESGQKLKTLKQQIVHCLNQFTPKQLKQNNSDTTKQYKAHYKKHSTVNLESDMENYSLFTYDDQIDTTSYTSSNNERIKRCLKPSDIKQGTFDDCYFLAAMASIASRKPELIYRLFVRLKNPYHLYTVRLFIDGQWQPITVNLQFPVNQDLDLCCVRRNDQNIWPLLLEKAYAKVSGSYENINWGTEQQGVQILTGAPSVHYNLSKGPVQDLLRQQCSKLVTKTTNQVTKPTNQVTILTTSVIVTFSPGYIKKNALQQKQERDKKLIQLKGLVPNHCYSILGVFTVTTQQDQKVTLYKLRNPWGYRDEGKMVWNGDWGLKSQKWNDKSRYITKYQFDPKDGTFFMCFADLKRYFKHVNICRINQQNVNCYLDLSTVVKNTFATVHLEINEDGIYSFTLHLKDRRKLSKEKSTYRHRWSWLFLLKENQGKYEKVYCICQSGENATLQNLNQLKKGDYKIVLKFNHQISVNKYQYCLSSYGPDKVKWQLQTEFKDADLDDYLSIQPWGAYQPYDYKTAQQTYKDVADNRVEVQNQSVGSGYSPSPSKASEGQPVTVQKQIGNLKDKPEVVYRNVVSLEERKFFEINREKTVCFQAPFMKFIDDPTEPIGLATYKRLQIYPDFGFGFIHIKNLQNSTFHVKIHFGKKGNYQQSKFMSMHTKPCEFPLPMTVPSGGTQTCKFIIFPEFDSKLITYEYYYEVQGKK